MSLSIPFGAMESRKNDSLALKASLSRLVFNLDWRCVCRDPFCHPLRLWRSLRVPEPGQREDREHHSEGAGRMQHCWHATEAI